MGILEGFIGQGAKNIFLLSFLIHQFLVEGTFTFYPVITTESAGGDLKWKMGNGKWKWTM